MASPQYITNTQYFGTSQVPHIINVRPVFVGGLNASFDRIVGTIAGTIRDSVIRAVGTYTSWGRDRILQETSGRLLASNERDGAVYGYTRTFQSLDYIDQEAIQQVFEGIQQSNAEINLTDLVWEFHISPTSIAAGGSSRVKVPSWANHTRNYGYTWKGYDGVNCATLALCALMYGTQKKYAQYMDRALEDAELLKVEMGWDDDVSLAKLGEFVEKYPTYRLTAFLPHCVTTPFTWTGAAFEYPAEGESLEKILYLVYDADQQHFAATQSPVMILRKVRNSTNWRWCHPCATGYLFSVGHQCVEGQSVPKKKRKITAPCPKCNIVGDHSCTSVTCKFCSTIYKKEEGFDHRCILYKDPRKDVRNSFYEGKGTADGKLSALWVYDFESRIQIVPSVRQVITSFRVDEEGHYLDQDDVLVHDFTLQKHEVNFVALRNVFTDETKEYFGEHALRDFILFLLTYNSGNNICIAHNASGYDTRLLFSGCKALDQKVSLAPIMRGGKFMQLKINGKTIFRDSLLHVRGSLKALAKDFCNGLLKKGYFPHLFNTVENYGYVGPLPDKKYFDLSFSARSKKDLDDFDEWYDSFTGDWNFMEELKSYCINDVLVLKEIVKGYHDIAVSTFQMSPWFNATAPSYVHEVFLTKLSADLELPDPVENKDEYKEKVESLAWNDHWAVLKPPEYWFARRALRGGRTEVRKFHHLVSDEDWERGVRIRYQDICSQYPFQQVVHDFPVGLPTIFVWDERYVPCVNHQNTDAGKCDCVHRHEDRACSTERMTIPWTKEMILAKPDFFGIVCATVEPPKDMYHPVLVAFDTVLNKSVASCERIVEGTFTSIEFVKALEHGYTLVQLHRYDQYVKKPSLWRDIILDLFLEKMINSKAAPEGEKRERLLREYTDLFGEDFGDKIQKTLDEGLWGKNPAKKQTAKIMMNSAWGKHAQRPIMPEAAIFHFENDQQEIIDFFENCVSNNYEYHDGTYLNDNQIMYKYSVSGPKTKPDLHGGYLPAGLFVPAYGRMQLWEQLHKLGKRVLMNDTDSIVYLYDPLEYNIPQGGLLGEWEVEDVDTDHGGIREFVGMGPKTYGIRCEDGFSMVKAKGMSLNFATENLINFDVMVDVVKSLGLKSVSVPQTTFNWTVDNGMSTNRFLKLFKFNKSELKGILSEDDGHLYPFGYIES